MPCLNYAKTLIGVELMSSQIALENGISEGKWTLGK